MDAVRGEQHWIEDRVHTLLAEHVDARGLGWVLRRPVVYVRRDPDTLVTPAVAFASRALYPDRPPAGRVTRAPELVVEVLSPDNRWAALRPRLIEYFAAGVRGVWVVSPDDAAVLVFDSPTGSRRVTGDDTVGDPESLPGLRLPVSSLFS